MFLMPLAHKAHKTVVSIQKRILVINLKNKVCDSLVKKLKKRKDLTTQLFMSSQDHFLFKKKINFTIYCLWQI